MKRPRNVDPPNDPNGGQYVPANPQYDAGYADGFKAGKEWMKDHLFPSTCVVHPLSSRCCTKGTSGCVVIHQHQLFTED